MNPLRLFLVGSLVALATSPLLHAASYTDAEAGQHVGETATVTGKIVAISKSSKGHSFLNFGERFPRQVFTGVVFARDEATIGDLKQYEGKQVALTGKIELSPDQKPQIVIRQAGQLALTDAAPAPPTTPAAPAAPPMPAAPSAPATAPMPAAGAPTPPSTPPATVVASAAAPIPAPQTTSPKIALASNWSAPGQGSEMIRKDLARLFGGASLPPEPAEVFVYPDIPYLMPLAVAKKRLNLEGIAASSHRVTCPGLPVGSLTAYSFPGVFPGGYTRVYLVADNADQLVSVLTVDENTRTRTSSGFTDTDGYHAYNFITLRVKGTKELVVKHELVTDGAPPGTLLVDTLLLDPTDQEKPATNRNSTNSNTRSTATRAPKSAKIMERSRWYVPLPLVNLILRCASGR